MPQTTKVVLCGEIATVMLSRPKQYNAFDLETISAVAEHLINLAVDDTIRAVVVTGEGKAFCAGADLKAIADWPEGPSAGFHNLAARFHQAILEIRRMPKPVIAAINGIAAGGGFSLALACDFRVMGKSAVLRQAYTSNGLSIDGGGTFTLPRMVGISAALEIAAFDDPISAERAMKWGLATKITSDEEVLETAQQMAEELAQKSLNSFAVVKGLFNDSFSTPFESHIERERAALRASMEHADGQEGIAAFLDKRAPEFNR